MAAEDHAMTLTGSPLWTPGQTYTVGAYWTINDTLETGDTFTASSILPSQKVTIVGGRVYGKEADTNASATGTIIVGDGTDTDGYLASQVWGGAESTFDAPFNGALMGTESAAGRNIVLTLGGTVATGATSGRIGVEVTYLCSNGARIS